ncbi:MAG TPA: glycosyltransferase family 4 protein, partial [Dehalococcoidia bacterium]|nr:glycosyltransferase family 4 protein [Dehalococcoidia bacterium]
CGLPVVASDVGDVAELVHDGVTGFLIDKGDHNALADRINLLLDDKALRERMGLNARKLIMENYSVELMGRRTLEVYHKVLSDNG